MPPLILRTGTPTRSRFQERGTQPGFAFLGTEYAIQISVPNERQMRSRS